MGHPHPWLGKSSASVSYGWRESAVFVHGWPRWGLLIARVWRLPGGVEVTRAPSYRFSLSESLGALRSL
ncbi:MAG: hypothetical protein RR574_00735 [Comamonas sp.]